MADLIALYRPVLGRRIVGLVWMPITADTPQLASELSAPSFSFSGVAYLRFEGEEAIGLTWNQTGYRFGLESNNEVTWTPHSLDRVQAASEPPWGNLIGSVLTEVDLFASSEDESRLPVGVKHTTTSGWFWVGTGGSDYVGDCDDLWVGADCHPPNLAGLVSIGKIP